MVPALILMLTTKPIFQEIPSQRPTTPLLDKVNDPFQLRLLSEEHLSQLSYELRAYLLYSVGQTGGHFGAGLGVIELTVALHYVFNTPDDRIVWDVGHQAYPHKILTGRREAMLKIRQQDGPAAFPSRDESQFDTFGVGHSSTSISAALGMALGAKLQGIDRKSIAVIGDGALTAGMAFEALSHAGDVAPDMLVILNDNDMSISNNVGGLKNHLARILSGKTYNNVRDGSKKVLSNSPGLMELARKTEEHVKGLMAPGTLFEELGFNYIGPIDGHDLPTLLRTLENMKGLKGPQFLHVITKKGKGFAPAEVDPIGYHAINKIEPKANTTLAKTPKPKYANVFGQWLCDMAEQDSRLAGITPAMCEGSDLVKFSERFADRYFDVAIAEQHAVTFAAGLTTEGYKPYVAIYSTFLQRAYDQVVHDVAIQSLPVRFAIDRAGLVGADGPTHAGSFDITYLSTLPNFIVMAASDESELVKMINTSLEINNQPCAIRYPRGSGTGVNLPSIDEKLIIGKGRIVKEGKKVALISFGARLQECIKASETLIQKGISTTVADARFAKPLDEDLILQLSTTHEVIITIEEGSIGGFGSHVMHFLAEKGLIDRGIKFRSMILPDYFLDQDTSENMYLKAGLDSNSIEEKVLNTIKSNIILSKVRSKN